MTDKQYIPKKRLKHSTNAEIKQLLEEVLGVSYNEGTEIRNNILSILFFTSYISAADLSYYMGMPENSFKSLHRQLNDLEKSGLIKSMSIGVKDGFSRSLYYPTENGYMIAAGLMKKPYSFRYKKRGKVSTTMHDYSAGLNVLQLLLYEVPFVWEKETSYSSSSTGMKKMGSLCIDGTCRFDDGKTIYFEEDLGNESVGILLGKLEKYEYYDLLSNPEQDCIIYSFREPYVCCDAPQYPAYSVKNINVLLSMMEEYSCSVKELYQKIETKQAENPTKENEEILSFIRNVSKCIRIMNMNNIFISDVGKRELLEFKKGVEELKSDFRVRDINYYQEDFTMGRMRSMIGVLARRYNNCESSPEVYITSLLKGFSVYCLSTNLIMNYLPYIYFNQAGTQYALSMCMAKYFPGINSGAYRTLHTRMENSNGPLYPLVLKNAIPYKEGTVCFEYISRDLGGVLRAMRFANQYANKKTRVKLVCMVDDKRDAVFFTNNAFIRGRYLKKQYTIIPDIIFLDISNLDASSRLFIVTEEGDIVYL